MRVDPDRFKLFLYTDASEVPLGLPGHTRSSGSAGLYVAEAGTDSRGNPRAAIGVAATQMNDPISLVATLAHEVGHEILLGQGRVSPEQSDHEPLTDLLTVFLGMGIFTANATIRDRGWSDGRMHGWETKRLGYLDQRMFGYALARFAWTRQETKPPWMRHVRPDVRLPMKKGIRFLADGNGID